MVHLDWARTGGDMGEPLICLPPRMSAQYLHGKLPQWHADGTIENEFKIAFRWYQERPNWCRFGWDLVGVPLIKSDTDKGIAADPEQIRSSFKYWYGFSEWAYLSRDFCPWEFSDNNFCHQSRSASDLIMLSKIYFEVRSIPIDDLAFQIVFIDRGNFDLVWEKSKLRHQHGHHVCDPLSWLTPYVTAHASLPRSLGNSPPGCITSLGELPRLMHQTSLH